MRSGIRNHQQRSDDPRCNRPLSDPAYEPKELDGKVGEDGNLFGGIDNTNNTDDFEVDPSGDFFGDYEDYSAEEFGLESDEDGYKTETDDGDNGDGEIVDEHSLEPERIPNPAMTCSSDEVEASASETQGANRLRGGAEAELKNKPYAVKFTKGKAGAVYANQNYMDENTSYTSRIGNPDNPFSPFVSKIDWEIAHWAKTRGPSSTAFTELMSIEGVCGITHT
jgi:hypothetical protein